MSDTTRLSIALALGVRAATVTEWFTRGRKPQKRQERKLRRLFPEAWNELQKQGESK